MNLKLSSISEIESNSLEITGSKSETNRLLILQALYPEIRIENVSNSDDSSVMQMALSSLEEEIDIHHAGTAMRFLTSYFAIKEGREIVLTGSQRMQERPIEVLVDALRSLGADITYVKNEGYPPIRIKGRRLESAEVALQANVSSQYISSLMLIASSLPKGLEINLEGKVTSVPYIEMTLKLLKEISVEGVFENNRITIKPKREVGAKTLVVESDWSSASYFYSILALAPQGSIRLSSYKNESLQGDSVLSEIYQQLGVATSFEDHQIILTKNEEIIPEHIELDLANSPDIAQTIAVTCFGLNISCHLTGLHTLKIKETDRLQALKNELEKLGGKVDITNDTLTLEKRGSIKSEVTIATYNDHRMAMAFAPLALVTPLSIADADVVSKSFPDFWRDLEQLGFKMIKE